jgi:hypothetical protein
MFTCLSSSIYVIDFSGETYAQMGGVGLRRKHGEVWTRELQSCSLTI